MKWWQWLVVIFTEVWPAVILVLLIGAAACCHGDEYQGWLGHWETVVATAYTPSDPIDDAYHDSKGARWRWITADGVTDVRRHPYGVAVPLRHGEPWLRFGTRVIIPTGLGYLDRSRADEREFVVDDVGKEHTTRSGFAEDTFDLLVRARHNAGLFTIYTSNVPFSRWSADYSDSMQNLIKRSALVLEFR